MAADPRRGRLFAALGVTLVAAVPLGLHPTQKEISARAHTSFGPGEDELFATMRHDAPVAFTAPPPRDDNNGVISPTLARDLFFDPGFSRDGKTACATCHVPSSAFASSRTVAGRNTPTLFSSRHWRFLNWDGSADGLATQANGPLTGVHEMAFDCAGVADRLQKNYAWAKPVDANTGCLTFGNLVARYVAELEFPPARFDVYARAATAGGTGTLEPVLNARELAGARVFLGGGRCVQCHHGPLLSDGDFHNVGVPATPDESPEQAAGRIAGIERLLSDPFTCRTCPDVVTLPRKRHSALGAFRTPSLRELTHTAPYMHNGFYPTLENAIGHYSTAPEATVGDTELSPVPLSAGDVEALAAFLRTLSTPLP